MVILELYCILNILFYIMYRILNMYHIFIFIPYLISTASLNYYLLLIFCWLLLIITFPSISSQLTQITSYKQATYQNCSTSFHMISWAIVWINVRTTWNIARTKSFPWPNVWPLSRRVLLSKELSLFAASLWARLDAGRNSGRRILLWKRRRGQLIATLICSFCLGPGLSSGCSSVSTSGTPTALSCIWKLGSCI